MEGQTGAQWANLRAQALGAAGRDRESLHATKSSSRTGSVGKGDRASRSCQGCLGRKKHIRIVMILKETAMCTQRRINNCAALSESALCLTSLKRSPFPAVAVLMVKVVVRAARSVISEAHASRIRARALWLDACARERRRSCREKGSPSSRRIIPAT